MDAERTRLRDLSARLQQLHRVLLERERRAWESRHGAVTPSDLLQLVLHDEAFAWLRSLSGAVARIDELVDDHDPLPAELVERVFGDTAHLLKSDARTDFHDKYRDALQDSPEVVMAHAEVSKVLPPRRA